METIETFLKNMPTQIIHFMATQEKFTSFENYLSEVQEDIEFFQKYGSFPATSRNKHVQYVNITNEAKVSKESTLRALNYNGPQIKQEKISNIHTNVMEPEHRNALKENIKIAEPDMPAKNNKKPDIESTTRLTRSKIYKANSSDNVIDDSLVILQQCQAQTLSMKNSDVENELNSYSKRTTDDTGADETTRNRSRKSSADFEKNTMTTKHTRSKMPEESSVTLSSSKQMLNETYLTQKVNEETAESRVLNETTIIQKDLINTTITLKKANSNKLNETSLVPIQLIPDNKTDDHKEVTLSKQISKRFKKGTTQIFSPFKGIPLRKPTEAFEKIGTQATSDILFHAIKTKARNNEKPEQESEIPKQCQKSQVMVSKDAKLTPRMQTRYLPINSYSASTAANPSMNEGLISTKAANDLKALQQEFKERVMQLREKEVDAVNKRTAVLQLQIDEKKRKREEKQINAKQQRAILERNKQKEMQQVEKTKEVRFKQAITEKQEKLKKHHEEVEHRRLVTIMRAAEEKHKEQERKRELEEKSKHMKENLKQGGLKKPLDETKLAKHTERRNVKNLPIYLKEKAPLLPTADCYDSDKEEVDKVQIRRPTWLLRKNMTVSLCTMQFVDMFVRKFFISNVTTPDLVDIFETIDPRKLKRTSSAVWRVPQRVGKRPKTVERKV